MQPGKKPLFLTVWDVNIIPLPGTPRGFFLWGSKSSENRHFSSADKKIVDFQLFFVRAEKFSRGKKIASPKKKNPRPKKKKFRRVKKYFRPKKNVKKNPKKKMKKQVLKSYFSTPRGHKDPRRGSDASQ